MWLSLIVSLIVSLLAVAAARAQNVVMYRCTDASGALTVQNDVPCPKGSRQEKRVMDAAPVTAAPPPQRYVPPPPAPVIPAAPVATPAATTATAATTNAIGDADRLPPPALFECRTYSNDRYLSDDGNPPQRCAPLQTTGLAGNASISAGSACQMTTDQCQRVADGALCEQWQQRLREAQSVLRFGRNDSRETAQADVERIGRIVTESTCGL